MTIDKLRTAISIRAEEAGGDAEAMERLALQMVLSMPASFAKELSEITSTLNGAEWSAIAERAAWSALVATDQVHGIERRKPPRIKPRLRAAPKIREFFWCDFPNDAQLPELWKRRPVLIVSYRQRLHDVATVIPCSSLEQDRNKWSLKISKSIDGKESWAICDKPCSVAVSRLTSDKSGIHRLAEDEFHEILKLLLQWLPIVPPEKAKPEGPSLAEETALDKMDHLDQI